MGALEDAVAALEREPSREHAAAVLDALVATHLDARHQITILDRAAERVMTALASRATITLDSPERVTLFRRWPLAVRAGFEVRIGDAPYDASGCPRCDRELQIRRDSYGMPTYTYEYSCPACEWFESHVSKEETLATAYSRMHDQDAAAERVARILHATYDVPAGCFPIHAQRVAPGDPLPAPLDQLAWAITELTVCDGRADHVRIPAAVFLEHGHTLRSRSPFRSVALTEAAGLETAILAHPVTAELAGLQLVGSSAADLADALITAPSLPALRHLAFDQTWLDRRTLEALVATPIATTLDCLHADLRDVIDEHRDEDGDDRFSLQWVNEHGLAVIELADRHPFLEPTARHLRTMEAARRSALARLES